MQDPDILNAEVTALRAEIARLHAANAALLNPPRPLPDLQTYGPYVEEVVRAVRDRGVHPTEQAWLADYIEALADFKTRIGD